MSKFVVVFIVILPGCLQLVVDRVVWQLATNCLTCLNITDTLVRVSEK